MGVGCGQAGAGSTLRLYQSLYKTSDAVADPVACVGRRDGNIKEANFDADSK